MAASEDKKDVKPATVLTLRVKEQSGEETLFRVKPTTKMSKILQAFAERKGVSPNMLRFLVDGDRVDPNDTPESLKLEDNDQVDCLLEQTGGA